MKNTYRDCFCHVDGTSLTLGNSRLQRELSWSTGWPVSTSFENRTTGHRWGPGVGQAPLALAQLAGIDLAGSQVTCGSEVGDNLGLSEPFLRVKLTFAAKGSTLVLHHDLWPDSPFVTTRWLVKAAPGHVFPAVGTTASASIQAPIEKDFATGTGQSLSLPAPDTVDCHNLNVRHAKLTAFELFDVTDAHDYPVTKHSLALYSRTTTNVPGSLFLLDDYQADEALLLVKEGPTVAGSLSRFQDELAVHGQRFVALRGSGIGAGETTQEILPAYGCTWGVGSPKTLLREYRRLYQRVRLAKVDRDLYIMSNTWGDRSQDKAVNESFLLAEIEVAAQIGVDIVQIDDGWQKGKTANSALAKGGAWGGYYAADAEFWAVNLEKFPRGLTPLLDRAHGYGIRLGLWFSPDSTQGYAAWQRDANTLLGLWRRYGICHFKLDGIHLDHKTSEVNLLRFLESVVRESQGAVTFNFDVTAEVRYGYLYEKHLGTLFVENRYTDWGNYFPHSTLRNLWLLSGVLPPQRLQMEVLNPRRNAHRYDAQSLFGPDHYEMDYLFASVMVSQPLLWMEMTGLAPADTKTLASLVAVYRRERITLSQGEVLPLGQEPDGQSFTGFQVITAEGRGYVLVFRESTKGDSAWLSLSDLAPGPLRLDNLAQSQGVKVNWSNDIDDQGRWAVNLSQPRSFVLARYSRP